MGSEHRRSGPLRQRRELAGVGVQAVGVEQKRNVRPQRQVIGLLW